MALITSFICFAPFDAWCPLSPRIIIKVFLYRLAHIISSQPIVDLYNVGTSTIKKCIVIVCDIPSDREKLFRLYLQIPSGAQIDSTTARFVEIIGISQI